MTSSTEYSKRLEERPLTELSLYHVWKGNVLLPSTNKLVPFDKISYKLDVKIQTQLGNLVITYQVQQSAGVKQNWGLLKSQGFSLENNGENWFSWGLFWMRKKSTKTVRPTIYVKTNGATFHRWYMSASTFHAYFFVCN